MLKPGTLVGIKYQIEHLIAEGGMAEVYLARCLHKHSAYRYVAIKRLKPCLAKVEALAELFIREAQLIITIRSDHIVKGLELIKDAGEYLLVMEFILGHEVGHVSLGLKNQSMKSRTEVALAVGLGVARALNCIRTWPDDKGRPLALVHGDISPQNIIVSTQGEIKLVDFGVAMSAAHSTFNETELLRGNIRYMSPEQRAGHQLTQASDIYSLAMVLEEIIGPKPPASLLGALIAKAKKTNLKQRYHHAADFLHDLEELSKSKSPFDPRIALRQALEHQSQECRRLSPGSVVPVFAIVLALVLILSLVVAGGIHYFAPKMPMTAIDDHHCANYTEDLGQDLRPKRFTIFNGENP